MSSVCVLALTPAPFGFTGLMVTALTMPALSLVAASGQVGKYPS